MPLTPVVAELVTHAVLAVTAVDEPAADAVTALKGFLTSQETCNHGTSAASSAECRVTRAHT